jgi:hypothetical protein
MALSAVKPEGPAHGIELCVAFRNVGSSDVVLDLGFMLANGKVQYPTDVQFALTDSKGQTRALHYPTERLVISGPVYDFLAPVPIGAIYVLHVNLERYCCFEPGSYRSKPLRADTA